MSNGGAPSNGCAKCGCLRRATLPIRMRSTPILWCANGSATGSRRRTKPRGRRRIAVSTTICVETTREGQTPTLADLAPLYHAIAHGCRAGRHQAALDEVYRNRICRRLPDGRFEFYSAIRLGAMDSNLAAISWFLSRPYEDAIRRADAAGRHGSSTRPASVCARRGRLQEALPAMRAGLRMAEEASRIGETRRVAHPI